MENKAITNENLIRFWNDALTLSEEDKAELKQENDRDYRSLAPSEKLCKAVEELGKCARVLDYGCGNAWAGIIAKRSGCPDVTAVDVGEGIIEAAKFYVNLFDAEIHPLSVAPEWLSEIKEPLYDGAICSNVLDVVPLETSKEIIRGLAQATLPKAKIIIGLNFYMPEKAAKKRGTDLQEGKYLFVNGVLRLLSLPDEEWKTMFAPYFEIEGLEYFAWPGEEKETRRLFRLRRK